MRAPAEILAKAATRYRSSWRDALLGAVNGPYEFNLGAPSAATIKTHPGDVAGWLSTWRTWTAQHPNAKLRRKIVRNRYGWLCRSHLTPDVGLGQHQHW